jgi:hypothetical protein
MRVHINSGDVDPVSESWYTIGERHDMPVVKGKITTETRREGEGTRGQEREHGGEHKAFFLIVFSAFSAPLR